jgi:hypothetical protein
MKTKDEIQQEALNAIDRPQTYETELYRLL